VSPIGAIGVSGRLTGWKAVVVWVGVPIDSLLILSTALVPNMPMVAILLLLSAILSFGIVGAIVSTRLPRNPIGWILWATATIISGSITGSTYATYSVAYFGGVLPGTVLINVVAQGDLVPLLGLVGIYLPLVFPDGHLPSARWRGVARFSLVAVAFASVLAAVTPGPLSGGSNIPNPLGIPVLAGAGPVLGLVMLAALAGPFLLAVGSVVVRYRDGGAIERQQLKWFAGASAVMVISVALGSSNIGPLAESGWLLTIGGLALLPVAIGVGVLRYRLYEIDRIISRTIGYAVVTGVLLLGVAGAILVSQAILARQIGDNPIVVAASTLVVAALFQPLRRRVQLVVDRRFDRSRYDAQVAADAFAVRLRDQVDLGRIEEDLAATVDGNLRPLKVGLWVRDVSGGVGA
jgi:hypothetical protein